MDSDPSHFSHQILDCTAFIEESRDRIYHVHIKDSWRRLDGRRSVLGSHLIFGHSARDWDFVSPGRGDVVFESVIRRLAKSDTRDLCRSKGRTPG